MFNFVKKKKISFICVLTLFFTAMPLFSLPSVMVYKLEAKDAPLSIGSIVNDLIFSFVTELKTYRVHDAHNDFVPVDDSLIPFCDYIFYGAIAGHTDGLQLTLVLQEQSTKIKRIIEKVYPNSNRILLESRVLVADIFDQSNKSLQLQAEVTRIHDENFYPVENINGLAGTWRGEKGLEKVVFLRGGKGIAVLSTGVSIQLDISIQGQHLLVKQKGSVIPRQFFDLPDTVAQKAINYAQPLEWSFLVSADKKVLSGMKSDTLIKNNGSDILSVEKVQFPVTWHKN